MRVIIVTLSYKDKIKNVKELIEKRRIYFHKHLLKSLFKLRDS